MPDDRIRMTSFNSLDPDVNSAYLGGFRGGEDVDYVTAGLGYSVGRSSFQLGAAVSDESTSIVGNGPAVDAIMLTPPCPEIP